MPGAKVGHVAGATIFLLVPVALFRYGVTHCTELSCVGPMANGVLAALTVIPLLILWIARRRLTYFAMLVCSEVAMTYATLRTDFDFSPEFMVLAIPIGLVLGGAIGYLYERHKV